MGLLLIDLALFVINIWNAIVNRGTILAWLSVLFIFWQVYSAIRVIREI